MNGISFLKSSSSRSEVPQTKLAFMKLLNFHIRSFKRVGVGVWVVIPVADATKSWA